METKASGILERLLDERSKLIETLVVAIVLAVGIDLVAGSLLVLTGGTSFIGLIFGLIVSSVASVFFLFQVLGQRSHYRNYEAFIMYDSKNNQLIGVPRYIFSDETDGYLRAAFAENPALRVIWDREPFRNFDLEKKSIPESFRLITELGEYFVLERLSTHLTDYFNARLQLVDLTTFERQDVPEILLQNRFLELFSRPLKERPQFVRDALADKEPGQVVMAWGQKGGFFSEFELVLPKGTTIRRPERNTIEINTTKVVITISIDFSGSNAGTRPDFEEYYLGLQPDVALAVSSYSIGVHVRVFFKTGALLTRSGWEYYDWVDSFLADLEREISGETFFESIGWEQCLTVLSMLDAREGKLEHKRRTRATANMPRGGRGLNAIHRVQREETVS